MGTKRQRRYLWTAAQTEHRAERTARSSVEALGFRVLFPVYKARPVRGVRATLPLFEGYLIFRMDSQLGSAGISSSKGIRSIVRCGECVCQIPDEEIRGIRSMMDSDGYVELESEEPPVFSFQSAVKALQGAFQDQIGEYRGIDQTNPRRALVAYQFMRREVVSSISRYDLARVV